MYLSLMPHLFTTDIERATAFYQEQLGFEQTFRTPPDGIPDHVELRLGDSMLALSTRVAALGVGLDPSDGNPLELIVWCDDVDTAVVRLRKAGAPVIAEPFQHVTHRRASVCDPDGNWIALVGD